MIPDVVRVIYTQTLLHLFHILKFVITQRLLKSEQNIKELILVRIISFAVILYEKFFRLIT